MVDAPAARPRSIASGMQGDSSDRRIAGIKGRFMRRIHLLSGLRSIAALLACVLGCALSTQAQQAEAPARSKAKKAEQDDSRTRKSRAPVRSKARRDRSGFYMGRQIADVMSWQGVDWLFRETRIEEEQPEAMLDALKISPGAT